jgi:hypothetical protein
MIWPTIGNGIAWIGQMIGKSGQYGAFLLGALDAFKRPEQKSAVLAAFADHLANPRNAVADGRPEIWPTIGNGIAWIGQMIGKSGQYGAFLLGAFERISGRQTTVTIGTKRRPPKKLIAVGSCWV